MWPICSLDCLSEQSKQLIGNKPDVFSYCITSSQETDVISVDRYSSLNKLFRVTAYVYKFIFASRKISGDSLEAAKMYWIKHLQRTKFSNELDYLQKPDVEKSGKVPELVTKLDLFLDSKGVIRSRGRIGKSTLYEYDVINPVLLVKDHHLTNLIIENCHKKCKHLGIQSTINTIRTNGFWIPRIRQAVEKVLSQCVTCQKFNSFSFRYRKMTNLPKHTVNLIKPFLHTGIYFTGHLWVKDSSETKVKMYLLIFTCLNVRAVHIKIVPDMTTQSFILAFLRFTNLYGVPSHIYSDNAKAFISGCNFLDNALVAIEFQEHFQNYNLKHIKIPS